MKGMDWPVLAAGGVGCGVLPPVASPLWTRSLRWVPYQQTGTLERARTDRMEHTHLRKREALRLYQ